MNAAIETYTIKRESGELVETMNAAGVPCGPIYSVDEVFADPQVQHLGMNRTVQHGALGPIDVVANAIVMGDAPAMTYTATPERGQHTEEVLAEFGYSEGEIRALAEDGVI